MFARVPGCGLSVRNDAGRPIVQLFGEVGGDGGVTATMLSSELASLGGQPFTLQINSPGGDVFEGIAAFNLLQQYPAPFTVEVIGLAASAASIIAMAGHKILIGQSAFLMIHRAWSLSIGDRDLHAESSALLSKIDASLAAVYAARADITEAQAQDIMAAETWLNGEQAVEQGFADGLIQSPNPRAFMDLEARYEHVPAALTGDAIAQELVNELAARLAQTNAALAQARM